MGLALAGLLWLLSGPGKPERDKIERWARELGMGYRSDFLIYNQEEAGKMAVPGEKTSSTPETGPSQGATVGKQPLQPVQVEIKPGAAPEEIAGQLAAAGLMNKAEFLRRVEEEGLSQRLRAGVYQVKPGDDIVAAISGGK